MKKFLVYLMAVGMLLSLIACGDGGGEETDAPEDEQNEEQNVAAESAHMRIDAICVDDSFRDKDESPLRMVYLYYTFTATDENLKIDSKYTNLIINETNTYESDHFADTASAAKFTPTYYYSSYIEDVYVGSSLKVLATFKIPEGDLAAGKSITFIDTQIPGVEEMALSTDDIQHFDSAEALAQAVDAEGYALMMEKREAADEETASQVKSMLNGYYWSFYVNNISYRLEFEAENNFTLTTSIASNSGTYTVQKGYIFCTYPETGYTVEIPYEIKDGEMSLDCVAGFDVKTT